MLHFFRRIRQSLLSKGRLSNYFLYALGELLLVVAGILIALQINNWNEKNKQQDLVRSYLDSLVENLEDDQIALEDFKEQCLFRYHAQNYLLYHGGGQPVKPEMLGVTAPTWKPNEIWNENIPDDYSKVFAKLGIIWIPRIRGAAYNQSAFREMNSTGIFTSINSKELKSQIAEYYEKWNSLIGDNRLNHDNSWVGQWANSLIDEGTYPFIIDESEDPITFVNNPKRLALMERFTTSACYHFISCTFLVDMSRDLIEAIKIELSN